MEAIGPRKAGMVGAAELLVMVIAISTWNGMVVLGLQLAQSKRRLDMKGTGGFAGRSFITLFIRLDRAPAWDDFG